MHCREWTSHVSVHANLKVPTNAPDRARKGAKGRKSFSKFKLPFTNVKCFAGTRLGGLIS